MSKPLQRDLTRNRPSMRAIKRLFSGEPMNTAYEIGLVFFFRFALFLPLLFVCCHVIGVIRSVTTCFGDLYIQRMIHTKSLYIRLQCINKTK